MMMGSLRVLRIVTRRGAGPFGLGAVINAGITDIHENQVWRTHLRRAKPDLLPLSASSAACSRAVLDKPLPWPRARLFCTAQGTASGGRGRQMQYQGIFHSSPLE